MSWMFYDCTLLYSIPNLNTGKVTDMENMLLSCPSLKVVDPHNYKLFDWLIAKNNYIQEKYPEFYL